MKSFKMVKLKTVKLRLKVALVPVCDYIVVKKGKNIEYSLFMCHFDALI